jgi:hypothetical protein
MAGRGAHHKITRFASMVEFVYILFLLVVMNFYLRFRMRDTLTSMEKFMLSLMGIGLLFVVFYLIAQIGREWFIKNESPKLDIVFMLTMTIIMPAIVTEIILLLYVNFIQRKKK